MAAVAVLLEMLLCVLIDSYKKLGEYNNGNKRGKKKQIELFLFQMNFAATDLIE